MSSRRKFLTQIGLTTGSLPFLSFANPLFAEEAKKRFQKSNSSQGLDNPGDEDFWGWVRESYTTSPNIINLNNGGVSPQPPKPP